MNPIDAQARLEVTLTAEQWNQVLGLLGEVQAPYRVTAPLIQSIGQQIQAAAEALPNGQDRPEIVRHVTQ